jgi:hypothetical protein
MKDVFGDGHIIMDKFSLPRTDNSELGCKHAHCITAGRRHHATAPQQF